MGMLHWSLSALEAVEPWDTSSLKVPDATDSLLIVDYCPHARFKSRVTPGTCENVLRHRIDVLHTAE